MQCLFALADPNRRRIVEMLARENLSSGQIASRFEISAPAVSQHLKALRAAKLVRVRREAQRRIYELDPTGVEEIAGWLGEIRRVWANRPDILNAALHGVGPNKLQR